ncbi:MAG: S-layer glycoprotein N-glycosyltransferase AglJ [Halodesulfurarchaeum sp.]
MPVVDDVCVLVPTLDEAETIGDVVSGFIDRGYTNVLVVDGGSADDTTDIAETEGATVIEQSGSGKGQAVREGLEYVQSAFDVEYVLMLDGDGTYRPDQADRLLEPLRDGEAEHVIGNRFADMQPGAMTRFNHFGNWIFNGGFARVHGENYQDILSGYRAFTVESADRMHLTAQGFGIETEMAVECVKNDVSVTVVPITYQARPAGSDPNLHPLTDGGRILYTLYSLAKTTNPMFYFGSVGAVSTVIGLLLGAYVGYEWFAQGVSHEVIAILATLGILFGGQLIIFGFLADLILTLHQDQLRRMEDLERE